MNRIQKIKQSIKDNRYNIAAVAFVSTFVVLAVAAESAEIKQQEENKKKLDKYIIEQNRAGKTVFQLANGSYIGVAV